MYTKKRHSTHLVYLNFVYMIRPKINYLLFGLVFLVAGNVIAQPEITVETDTIFVALDTLESGEISTHWVVANNQFGTQELMCSRNFVDVVDPYNYPYIQSTEENPVPGSYEKFCWGPICYNYGADESSSNSGFLVSIPQNQADSTFIAYFYPNGVTGTSTIEYCFHPVGNENIGACATITYLVTETAYVSEAFASEAIISSAYPNPIVGKGSIDYNIPPGAIGEIVARDITGKAVMRFGNLNSDGRVSIDATELAPGLYFTTLEINGTATTTKRFVVAK